LFEVVPNLPRVSRGGLFTGLLLLAFVSEASAAGFAGRRVGEVLDGLRSQGLTFIYNTEIVADDLRVAVEPQSTGGLALAR
jgi:hypothetical protein